MTLNLFKNFFVSGLTAFAFTALIPVQASANEAVLGPQRIAVVLLDLAHDGKEQASEEIRQAMFDSEFSIDRFIRESSYGKASLTGTVFPWIQVNERRLPCEPTEKQSFAYAGNSIPYENFDRVVFLYHVDAEKCADAGLGESEFGKHWVRTSRGNYHLSVARLQADNRFVRPQFPFQQKSGITSGVIAHELGHSFGINGHANILDCGAKSIPDQRSGSNDSCEQYAIADRMSGMGGEGFYRPAIHWASCHKEDLGWMSSGEMVNVPSSLITREALKIKIFPYASGDAKAGPVAIKIPLGTPIWVAGKVQISALFIEYRTAIGFDRRLKEFGENPAAVFSKIEATPGHYPDGLKFAAEGLQVRGGFYNDGHCVTTYAFDAHPNSLSFGSTAYSLYDHLDGNLLAGEGMDEPNNGFRIEAGPVQADGSIEVTLKQK